MRVVFLEDVAGVAQGGDVKEVKNGFARNYLIPKKLAVPATHNALQGVQSLQKRSESVRVSSLRDIKAMAEVLDGAQINIEMRAGSGGRLYGSVTTAMVAEALAAETEREIDRRTIVIEEPIREVGTVELNVQLHPEVTATIKVLVYPTGTDPNQTEDQDEEQEPTDKEAQDTSVEGSPAVDEAADDAEDSTEADGGAEESS
jgi:large subunit ribosomal protein L9